MSTSRLIWLLRLGGVMCFVGHGVFGVMTKEGWVPYFALFGIGREMAFQLMPLIGWADILMGVSLLFTLRPALLAWMIVWTVFTAALRPMAGEPVWEMLERAGNYGVPAALLLLVWPRGGWRAWLTEATPRPLGDTRWGVQWALLASCAMLLLGHGALSAAQKPAFVKNVSAVLPGLAATATSVMGGLDVALALAVVAVPSAGLAVLVAAWKLAVESLFLASGSPFWEVVERGGSYIVPLAIAFVRMRRSD